MLSKSTRFQELLQTISTESMEEEEVARGYFCFFVDDTPHGAQMMPASVFEYFPQIDAYRLWYPNSHEDLPVRENAVFYPDFLEP